MQATFLALKQGDRSVEEYDLEFNRLARFSPAYVSSKELKREQFIAGLKEELRGNVASQSSFVYTKALQVATLLDSPRTDKLQLGIAQPSHTTAQGKVDGVNITHAEAIWILGTFRTSMIVNN